MSADDVAYGKSVRNMAVVLGVVVLVVFASLALSSYFDITPSTFQTRTSAPTSYAFTLNLSLNTTSATTTGRVAITGWLNGTSTGNVTAGSMWAVDQSRLAEPACSNGFPVGVGVMQGHYTSDNYSLGTLMPLVQIHPGCPVQESPAWFYFSSQTPRVLVAISGKPHFWTLSENITFGPALLNIPSLARGVYTAVAADEWGDLVMTNFRIS